MKDVYMNPKRMFLPVKDSMIEKISGFEQEFFIPQRATNKSAGYDFKTPVSFSIHSGQTYKVYTNIKAFMQDDEYLDLNIRSSMGMKKNLRIKNCTGIIDADYFSNESNDGNIIIALKNEGQVIFIERGEKIAQGIFKKYLITTDDNPVKQIRTGGIGSTGLK